jgi:hypothetical protein
MASNNNFPELPVLRLLRIVAVSPFSLLRRHVAWLWELQNRERLRIWAEMRQMRGLVPLLMKQRNGCRWSAPDRAELKMHLRHLAHVSPYLVLLLAPGGVFGLPLLAWWLDRRRLRRGAAAK